MTLKPIPVKRIENKSGKKFSLSFLKSILKYNPNTGKFVWMERRDVSKDWNTRYAGKIAGNGSAISIFNVLIKIHQLAFFYMTGRWPKYEIDHKNKNRRNNRWSNLREATRSQNQHNVGLISTNTSGYKGVSKHGKYWMAQIGANNKKYFLGLFEDPKDADKAYRKAAKLLHKEFSYA